MRVWLVALVAVFSHPPQDQASVLAQAEAEQKRLVGQYVAALRAWKPGAAEATEVPSQRFIPLFEAGAARYAGSEGAIPFLTTLLVMDTSEGNATSRRALDTLLSAHVTSPKLEGVVGTLPDLASILGSDAVAKAITTVIEKTPHARVKGTALHLRARHALAGEPSDEQRQAALADLRQAVEIAPNGAFVAASKRVLFAVDRLQVGMVAPDIEGKDADGFAFKLSDYRGKVTLLDFWGDWCGVCRAMYPLERSLVEKHKNGPFALIGVNSDRNLEKLRQVVKSKNLPWRSFWDGKAGPDGPIASQWNIVTWPTLFLIDHTGVIRFRGHDIPEQLLDELVSKAKG